MGALEIWSLRLQIDVYDDDRDELKVVIVLMMTAIRLSLLLVIVGYLCDLVLRPTCISDTLL